MGPRRDETERIAWSSSERQLFRAFVSETHGSPTETLRELKTLMSRETQRVGLHSFMYYRLALRDEIAAPAGFFLSTIDPAVFSAYRDNDNFAQSIGFQHVRATTVPYRWKLGFRMLDEGRALPLQAYLLGTLRDQGIRDGLTVPLVIGGALEGVNFLPDPSDSRLELISDIQVRKLRVLASFFQAALTTTTTARDALSVPKREVEILKWASEGYLAKEIADKLSTSRHTVAKQSVSVQSRLSAATLTEAVAKAIKLGLID